MRKIPVVIAAMLTALLLFALPAQARVIAPNTSQPDFTELIDADGLVINVAQQKTLRERWKARAKKRAKQRERARSRDRARRAKARRIKQSRQRTAKAQKRRAARAKLYQRTAVRYRTREKAGTIIVDTGSKHLYHVLGNGRAMRYGVAVGKAGFGWKGSARIKRKAKWPTWTPPASMIKRKPHLAKWRNGQPGGPANPLGAAALYLYQGKRDTLYRIHGTNNPASIGTASSSGCVRLRNEDIQHLYANVGRNVKVIVR
ncbi:L,D-transpeptidase [Ahrensia sp. R2A130]|uniref:L,D-transpeptidase n=1 Tax=Ahrensia sp. R2A130 TaxID=744979 RepID=UPI001FFF7291|nr:L,D-transpeptidase [Ahrensia sp. R2A130]